MKSKKYFLQRNFLFAKIPAMSELSIHTNVTQPMLHACKVLNKAHQIGMRVAVLFDNEITMDAFDRTLWTFNDACFIPHATVDSPGAKRSKILLSTHAEKLVGAEILLLMCTTAPHNIDQLYNDFPKIIDIVGANDPFLTEGRKRFVVYRKAGITPVIHNIANR